MGENDSASNVDAPTLIRHSRDRRRPVAHTSRQAATLDRFILQPPVVELLALPPQRHGDDCIQHSGQFRPEAAQYVDRGTQIAGRRPGAYCNDAATADTLIERLLITW